MSVISTAIDVLDQSSEIAAKEVKSSLEMLDKLAQAKKDEMLRFTDDRTKRSVENLEIPAGLKMFEASEVRVVSSKGSSEGITIALDTFLDAEKRWQTGVSKLINTALNTLLGSAAGASQNTAYYLIALTRRYLQMCNSKNVKAALKRCVAVIAICVIAQVMMPSSWQEARALGVVKYEFDARSTLVRDMANVRWSGEFGDDSGVYVIVNPNTAPLDKYVGTAANLQDRLKQELKQSNPLGLNFNVREPLIRAYAAAVYELDRNNQFRFLDLTRGKATVHDATSQMTCDVDVERALIRTYDQFVSITRNIDKIQPETLCDNFAIGLQVEIDGIELYEAGDIPGGFRVVVPRGEAY
ncbi:MAG: hypothetical protein F6K36_27290 [Symploca sp. SIO3C6]|nr:hypothetical protein [Symploca sp. SIO3C6]